MTSRERDYLLDAYEALVMPRTVAFIQHNEQGISCRSTVRHASLLSQLREAIIGGIGSKGASSDGKLRLPFDAEALRFYDEIEKESGEWLTAVTHGVPLEGPEANFDAWYRGYRDTRTAPQAGRHADELEKFYIKKLLGWAKRIESMFDPLTRLEISVAYFEPVVDDFGVQRTRRRKVVKTVDGAPVVSYEKVPVFRKTTRPAECPECNNRFAFDPSNGDRQFALIGEYQASASPDVDSVTARCRFCRTEWSGRPAVDELLERIDLHEREIASRDPEPVDPATPMEAP